MNVKERKTRHSATLFFLYRAVDIDTGWIKDARKKNGYYDINVMN